MIHNSRHLNIEINSDFVHPIHPFFAFAKRSVDSKCKRAFALAGGKSTEEPILNF